MKRRRPEPEPEAGRDDRNRDVMTLREAAEYLDCSYATMLPAGHEGRPPGISVRRRWRWLAGSALRLGEVDRGETAAAGRKSGPKARKQKRAAKKPAPRKGRSRK